MAQWTGEMLLQTNSYVVPKERQAEHKRLMRRFRQVLTSLGCEDFEVYEQTGPNWGAGATGDRFVQMMRFRDRKQHAALQAAERNDPAAQQLIAEFCELVNFQYQQQQGFFAVGFYNGLLPPTAAKNHPAEVSDVAAESDPLITPSPEMAAETQAYAAEQLAESAEPGHLADDESPDANTHLEPETSSEMPVVQEQLEEQVEPPVEEIEPTPPRRGSLFSRRKPG